MGYQVDADLAALRLVLDAVDRQAGAVDGDGAFVGQVLGQGHRGQHAQLPAFTHLLKIRDLAHAIDMAGHDMAAQAVMGTQGFFKIDGTQRGQTGGFVERFGRHIDGELLLGQVQGGGGHTSAIERNAVAQAHIVQVMRRTGDGQALAMG